MGCAFEAAKSKQQRTKKQQQQQQEQQQQQNQCGARRVTRTTAITTITRTTTTKPAEDIKIKDNYQQNHKTARETETETANDSKHLKARAQVLLTTQQQQQSEQQHPATQQQPSRSQVVYSKDKDENKEDELAGRQRIGIDIQATTTNTTKQITCSNCYSQRRKRQHRQQYQQDKDHVRLRSRLRPPDACTAAAATAAAATTAFNFQEMLWQATVALANTNHNHDRRDRNEDELAYQRWQPPPLPSQSSPSPLPSQSPSPSYLPATTAAMSASILATSASAAYQYLGQHYKHYSQSFSFYAASSVILMLCYLTTATTAAATQSETSGALDKHPIHGIDWSKFDESSSDKEILDLLLEKKRYDKRLLPPVNDEDFCCGLQSPDMATNQNARRPHNRGTLTVNVNVLLLSLASPDESSLKYEVEFLLNQQWNDPRLQYGNKSHYDFLNALHHHDSIWTPDTYFIMHGDFKDPIIPMHFALRIFRNGTITYAMRRHLILSCQGSLHIFPFDDPKCSFSMESISYEEAQIKYVWKNDEDTLRKSPSLTTLNAYLIKNQTTACDQNSWRGNYSCLRVDLIFTRDRAFYFTTVFIPGIILVTSSFITFWLEWNAVPARSMIGVTTMLNFFTTSNGFRSTLPVVSNLTAMNVWDGVCMCFIYASLLEFVCVNYVGRKRPLHNVVYRPGENPVTQRLPAVLSRIGVILASPLGEKRRDAGATNEIVACTTCGGGSNNSPCTHSANNGCATETCFVQVRKKEPPHPIRVAKTIDVIARITFPTAYAIFLIFFFVHYKGFS
ncbi:glutamate-gated chloride channel isoform X11 [Drosophila tropicalis]|uniref:glutamate-gated chloride channel isoform X11 n=1 Tax=Drosophila tropicalis TaxID=46794 RepID=UPI0035AC2625